jgi:hypothetical protein
MGPPFTTPFIRQKVKNESSNPENKELTFHTIKEGSFIFEPIGQIKKDLPLKCRNIFDTVRSFVFSLTGESLFAYTPNRLATGAFRY